MSKHKDAHIFPRFLREIANIQFHSIHLILLMFLLFFFPLVSLCTFGDYVPNRDIIIIKLNETGFDEWQVKLDSTFDDSAESIIETREGDLAVAGSIMLNKKYSCLEDGFCQYLTNYPRIILLNNQGHVLHDFRYYSEANSGIITTFFGTQQGQFLMSTHYTTMLKCDNEGHVLWKFNVTPTDYDILRIYSIEETLNGDYIFVGETSPKGDIKYYGIYGEMGPDGSLKWSNIYPNSHMFTELAIGTSGEAIVADDINRLYLLDSSKRETWNVSIPGEILDIKFDNGNTRVLSDGREFLVNGKGNITATKIIRSSGPLIWTNDGGFASVSATGGYKTSVDRYENCIGIRLSKFDQSGNLILNQTIPCTYGGSITSLIQTKDGGYAILLKTDKRKW